LNVIVEPKPGRMNKKLFSIIGLLAVAASLAMYLIGSNSSHLTELKTYWLAPLPIALICFIAANKRPANK
jgi:uncharacterized membrane protein YiaA